MASARARLWPGSVVGCGPSLPASRPTGNAAGGTGSGDRAAAEARPQLANDAFNGGPYGAEVARNNIFAGFTFDATDNTALLQQLAATARPSRTT